MLGDEIVEALRDGPMGEQRLLDVIGSRDSLSHTNSKDSQRHKKHLALQRMVRGDFVVRQVIHSLQLTYNTFTQLTYILSVNDDLKTPREMSTYIYIYMCISI